MTTALSSTGSKLPKLVVLDRDNVIIHASSDPASPFYYITQPSHVFIKPGAREALKILNQLYIFTVLATKQRCISKGLVTRDRVDEINREMSRLLDHHHFDRVYVEPTYENKECLLNRIALDYHKVKVEDVWVFDDSEDECRLAEEHGFTAFCTTNLYEALTGALGLI